MNCPACRSEIHDHSYRCKECHRICSYKRLCWRYRYVLLIIVALVSLWTIKIYTRRLSTPDYAKVPPGALVSDATTRRWLGLSDDGWFCEEPHRKGELLHLRHRVFQAKDVIVFIHGFIGDYVDTWGKPSVLLDDPRFNRNYDFVFYGFKTALYGDVPAFDDEAAKLDSLLTRLEENYKSITLVTHSKGGLLAMRAILNRTKDFSSKQSYKIHRIVMFTPLTENVSLGKSPGLVKLLGSQSKDINQMQANNYSELGKVKEDLKSLLDPHDVVSEARKERFLKNVADHLFVINAEGDEVVDVGANGEKIVSEGIRKLSELPTLGAPHLATLRYKDIGGSEEDARVAKSGELKDPSYAHSIVVKMGVQQDFSFFDHFEELLWERIGTPPRNFAIDVEQIRQNTYERIADTMFEMNRFVVEKNPMVGLCWRNINQAVEAKLKDVPEPERPKKTDELIQQIYYVYIFLDQYAHLDDLRARGIISANDAKIAEWKRSMLPNLIGSEIGNWMLENNLTEYYSEQMNKDLREAAASVHRSDVKTANRAVNQP
ncbi:MAG TPA: alpha/beta hydrolase [Candidatus Udaeobacter sp.]|nr:alpha/beta hydrolase [Candidatus Udaeobacter sp.]